MKYDAFMSYSHAGDSQLAAALQSALHRFAKPWYRLRALHVFRDKTDLSTNPRLWESIRSALDAADWFILLASPPAAVSIWIQREVDHWLERRPADRILIVLTAGTVQWDPSSASFDRARTDALPARLNVAFAEEPLYLDLRWAKEERDLSTTHPRFVDAVADLSSTLHGRPKDEVVGEDVRQHRRTRRLARSAIAGLAALTIASTLAAVYAMQQRTIAETQRAVAVEQRTIADTQRSVAVEQRKIAEIERAAAVEQRTIADTQRAVAVEQSRIALARQLAAQSGALLAQFPDRLPLALLLALESTGLQRSFEGNQALRAALSRLPRVAWSAEYRGAPQRGRIRALAFSGDGTLVAAAREDGTAELLNVRQGRTAALLVHDENPGVVPGTAPGRFAWKAAGVDEEVISVAFSQNGRFVATGSNDKTARLWETATGREVARLVHQGGVASVAFHPAGTYVATGSKDGNARLWEIPGGREAWRFKHDEEVRAVAFSPDGHYLAAISTDGGIGLLKLDDSKLDASDAYTSMWGMGDSGLDLVFSADSTRLATASGSFAAVFDVRSGKALFKATHAAGPESASHHLWIQGVTFSPDSKSLATAGRDGTARVWNLATGQELVRIAHAAPVEQVAFSPDGDNLSTASFDGTARLWELPSGRERLRAVHPGGSEVVAFSPDGSRVASGGPSGTVQLWHLTEGDQRARMILADRVRAIGLSPDGTSLVTADDKDGIRLWSSAGEPRSALRSVWGARRLLFSDDGRFIAAHARTPNLFVIDIANGFAAKQLPRFANAGDPALSRRYLAAWDRQQRALRVWETSGARELRAIEADDLWDLAFDPTGAFLTGRQQTGRNEQAIRVWALPGLRETGRVPVKDASVFALGPGGRHLAVTAFERGDGRIPVRHYVDVWNVAEATRAARIPHDKPPVVILFDPSGTALFTRGDGLADDDDRELRVWELPSGKLRARLGHEDGISAIRFSPEANILATVSKGRVYVWNSATGQLLSQLADAGGVVDVRFSFDGRYLLTGSINHTAILWPWKTDDMRTEACRRLTRNLSITEWATYLGSTPYRATCPNLPSRGADLAPPRK